LKAVASTSSRPLGLAQQAEEAFTETKDAVEVQRGEKSPGSEPSVLKAPRKDPDFQYINLRKFQRVTCEIPLSFRIIDYKGVLLLAPSVKAKLGALEFQGNSRDISVGGIYFSVPEQKISGGSEGEFLLSQALESGSILEMKILLSDGGDPVNCMAMAKILRVTQLSEKSESEKNPFCRVGAAFLSIDSEDRHRLMKFCEMNQESA
jgi:hypothetical protein